MKVCLYFNVNVTFFHLGSKTLDETINLMGFCRTAHPSTKWPFAVYLCISCFAGPPNKHCSDHSLQLHYSNQGCRKLDPKYLIHRQLIVPHPGGQKQFRTNCFFSVNTFKQRRETVLPNIPTATCAFGSKTYKLVLEYRLNQKVSVFKNVQAFCFACLLTCAVTNQKQQRSNITVESSQLHFFFNCKLLRSEHFYFFF